MSAVTTPLGMKQATISQPRGSYERYGKPAVDEVLALVLLVLLLPALLTAEYVRQHDPAAFDALERSLFETHFVDNRPLDDAAVLDELVARSGADSGAARAAVEDGAMDESLRASMTAAAEVGVTGTPAWLVEGGMLIPGAQPRDVLERWVRRMQERRGEPA